MRTAPAFTGILCSANSSKHPASRRCRRLLDPAFALQHAKALVYTTPGLVERRRQVSRALSRGADVPTSGLLPAASQPTKNQLVQFLVTHHRAGAHST